MLPAVPLLRQTILLASEHQQDGNSVLVLGSHARSPRPPPETSGAPFPLPSRWLLLSRHPRYSLAPRPALATAAFPTVLPSSSGPIIPAGATPWNNHQFLAIPAPPQLPLPRRWSNLPGARFSPSRYSLRLPKSDPNERSIRDSIRLPLTSARTCLGLL